MPHLGKLEAAVMDVLWSSSDALTVWEVLARLGPKRKLAYTTVMTVLSNLNRKAMVEREVDGRAYRYRPAITRPEVVAATLREVLEASGDARSALLHFAKTASDEESSALRDALARRNRKPRTREP